MALTCLIDQTTHASREDLHAHLRGKMRQDAYYCTYLPRFDRADGRPIPFKTVDQYLSQDFVDKHSMNRWLKAGSPEAKAWALEWLHRRKCEKQLIYAPSEVELKTSAGPSMTHYEALGGYYVLTREMGFAARYYDEKPLPVATTSMGIICDTREKAPLELPFTTRDTLNVGDYALSAPHDLGIRIERKSLSDFCGTLSDRDLLDKDKNPTGQTPLRRFDAELARAEKASLYVIMTVEADLATVQSFNHLPHMRHVKASPAYLLKNLRDLLVKYPLSFQAVFFDGRAEMAAKVLKLFQMGHQVKTLDLQWQLSQGHL